MYGNARYGVPGSLRYEERASGLVGVVLGQIAGGGTKILSSMTANFVVIV